MITAHNVGEDEAVLDPWEQTVGHHKVIDAPPRIPLPGTEHIAPPGILHPVGVKCTEGVGKARIQQAGKLLPLFIGETRTLSVCGGIFEVNFVVGSTLPVS